MAEDVRTTGSHPHDEDRNGGAARVLFVEFVTTDRFHCALHFPFAHGLLLHRGHAVRWLRFAMPAAVQHRRDEAGIGLGVDEARCLTAALREHGATHVLFSHAPALSLVTATRVAAPDPANPPPMAVFGSTAGLATGNTDAALPSFERLPELWQWLGDDDPLDVDPHAPPLDLPFDPHYGYEPMNAAAAEMQPFVFVLAGFECSYVRSLAENPFFDGLVDDESVPARFGCTFCRRPAPAGGAPRGIAPVDWAIRQLVAIARTHPPSPTGQLSLRIVGEHVFRAIDEFAAAVARLELAPAEILIDTRSDTLVRSRDRLATAARTLGAAGHRLELCLLGVESFVAADLSRFNKGFGPETNLAAIRLLRELEHEVPESFGFRKYGGLSTVLYTPWTTLEDVALNLAAVRFFRLKQVCGKVLTSRVRLYDDLPLAAAARRDGLLLASYDDPLLDTARRNFYAAELPWRFRDERVARFNRIATRLQTDPALAGDPLYEDVQRWRSESQQDELDLAERLCEAIGQRPDEEDPESLMAAALGLRSRRRGPRQGPEGVTDAARPAQDGPAVKDANDGPPAGPPRGASGEPPATGRAAPPSQALMTLDPLLARSVDWRGFVAGIKPVCRVEPLSPAEIRRIEPKVRRALPDVAWRTRRRDWGAEESYELIVGRREDHVAELCAILDARDGGVCGDEGRRHVDRTGELLGYPACCAKRFSESPESGWLHNEWLHVRNRVEQPGSVPTSIRPLNGPLSYVTCSASCAEAQGQAAILEEQGDEFVHPDWARWPVLFLLDRPAHFAVLEPLDEPGERFRYRLAQRFGRDPRLARLTEGDAIEITPGQIRVLRGQEVLVHFSLDAYVWWHERAFFPEYWRLVVQQKLDPVPVPAEEREPEDEPDRGVDDEVPELPEEQAEEEEAATVPRLDLVLGWMKQILEQAGLACRLILPTPAGELDFVFQHAGRRVDLRWRNLDAPPGVLALLGAPVVPGGSTSAATLRELVPLVDRVLAPAWHRGLRDRLDRANREHDEIDPAQGVRFLLRRRLAEGRPLWGSYTLERFDEELGDDGRPRTTLVARAGRTTVRLRFAPGTAEGEEGDRHGARFFTSSLGALRVVEDGRSAAQRRRIGHQLERCLGFHFSRAVPPEARWSEPPAGERREE